MKYYCLRCRRSTDHDLPGTAISKTCLDCGMHTLGNDNGYLFLIALPKGYFICRWASEDTLCTISYVDRIEFKTIQELLHFIETGNYYDL